MGSLPGFAGIWMRQWRAASVALADQRASELRSLTDDEARAAMLALLGLGAAAPLDPVREASSGLVEQQILFQRARRPR